MGLILPELIGNVKFLVNTGLVSAGLLGCFVLKIWCQLVF